MTYGYPTCEQCGADASAQTYNPELCHLCGAILPAPEQAERRKATLDYRERVNRLALWYVRQANGDHDTALDNVAHDIADTSPLDWPQLPDVATLLRRRADTVKGLRNA